MDILTLNDLSQNSFRVLGLTGAATQADVDQAARKFRIWDDPAQIPATANDAAWMGPVRRSRDFIEQAVARLAAPETRIEDRLWWFCDTPPSSDKPTPVAQAGSSVTAQHDAALIELYRQLVVRDCRLAVWPALLNRFDALGKSDDYLAWLLETEAQGEFEKRANAEEIAAAQARMGARLDTALLTSVDDALEDDDFAKAASALKLLRRTTLGPRTKAPEGVGRVLDRMEDALVGRCNECSEAITAAWKTRQIAAMRPACHRASAQFEAKLLPLVQHIEEGAAEDMDRRHRARAAAANLLVHAAAAFEAMPDFVAAQNMLYKAVDIARGTAVEPTIQRQIAQLQPGVERQRLGMSPRGTGNPRAPSRQPPTAKRSYRNYGSGIGLGGRLTIIGVFIVIMRLVAFQFTEHTVNDNLSPPEYGSTHNAIPTVVGHPPGGPADDFIINGVHFSGNQLKAMANGAGNPPATTQPGGFVSAAPATPPKAGGNGAAAH